MNAEYLATLTGQEIEVDYNALHSEEGIAANAAAAYSHRREPVV